MSWWLRRDEIDSKKECFGIFRADNNPAKWEVNQLIYNLTCPDYKLGCISIRSQDLANENQDDTYIMCFAAWHIKFTQTNREKRSSVAWNRAPRLICRSSQDPENTGAK